MDHDTYTDADEARRTHCLEKAIDSSTFGTTDEIVARAREFEKYLRGNIVETSPVIVDINMPKLKPEPMVPGPRPLPMPRHSTSPDPGNPCLACEWTKLKRRIQDRQAEGVDGE